MVSSSTSISHSYDVREALVVVVVVVWCPYLVDTPTTFELNSKTRVSTLNSIEDKRSPASESNSVAILSMPTCLEHYNNFVHLRELYDGLRFFERFRFIFKFEPASTAHWSGFERQHPRAPS